MPLSFESAGAKRPAGAEPPEQGAWSWASRAPIANMCRFGFNSLEAACLSLAPIAASLVLESPLMLLKDPFMGLSTAQRDELVKSRRASDNLVRATRGTPVGQSRRAPAGRGLWASL